MRVPLSLAAGGLVAAWFQACGLPSSGLGGMNDAGAGGSLDDVFSGTSSSSAEGGVSSSASGSSSGNGSSSASGGGSSSGGSSSSGSSGSASSGSSGSSSSSSSSSSSGGTCSALGGCYTIPGGWAFIAFATSQGSACPSGFANAAPTNFDESPSSSNVCTCGACSTTTLPTCQDGAVQTSYDLGGGTCGSPTPALANSPGGSCATNSYKGSYAGFDLRFVAPPASGGQCSSPGDATGTVTYASLDRACTLDSPTSGGCSGDECTPSLPSPYMACIIQNGSSSCPSGSSFSQQHLVGTGSDVTCTACGCNVTATCSGEVVFYADSSCTQGESNVAADSACHAGPTSDAGSAFSSYKYIANAPGDVQCASTGSSSATAVTLSNEQTVCCVP